jgi:hypothetical protein
MRLVLRVDDLSVGFHDEYAAAALDQLCVDSNRLLDFRGHPGRVGEIVSGAAVLDLEFQAFCVHDAPGVQAIVVALQHDGTGRFPPCRFIENFIGLDAMSIVSRSRWRQACSPEPTPLHRPAEPPSADGERLREAQIAPCEAQTALSLRRGGP